MFQNKPLVQNDPAAAREFAQITLDSIGDAVIGTNLAGNVAYLNRAAESMTGWPRGAALGRPLHEVFRIIDGVNRAAALNPQALAIQHNKDVGLRENRVLIRRDGFESAIEDSVAPILDRQGHAIGAVMLFRNVSEARAASPSLAECAQLNDLADLPRRQPARCKGKDSYHSHAAQMNARAIEKLDTESALRKALTQEEFVLHYQPKIGLDDGKISGVEALIRWNRPGHGLIPPLDFIPILEQTGLIVPVGVWIIHTVCRQIAEWQRSGIGTIRVAINLSSRQLSRDAADTAIASVQRQVGFAPQLLELEIETARAVRANGVDPALLEFELTESVLLSHAENSVAILRRLKRLGIRISTDDFGTGFSSLAYLKRFPIDTIKIDQIFIRDVTVDASDAAITMAIIGMAHSLKLKVIAEGVETREQLEFLRARDCDEIQGFYFSRPLPAPEISKLLRSNHKLTVSG